MLDRNCCNFYAIGVVVANNYLLPAALGVCSSGLGQTSKDYAWVGLLLELRSRQIKLDQKTPK